MGILDKFEKGVENVTSRAMSRFSDDVEPIEIASKVRETMDKRAASFARDRSVVPNVFRIHLAPSDVSRIESWGLDEMIRQMEEVATTHASEQGYSFVGPGARHRRPPPARRRATRFSTSTASGTC